MHEVAQSGALVLATGTLHRHDRHLLGVEIGLHRLARRTELDGAILTAAISATFSRRQTLRPTEHPFALTNQFSEDSAKLRQWQAFLNKEPYYRRPAFWGAVIAGPATAPRQLSTSTSMLSVGTSTPSMRLPERGARHLLCSRSAGLAPWSA